MKTSIWIAALLTMTLAGTLTTTLAGVAQAQDDSGSNDGDTVSIETRQEMEQKIGADISDVRVHTDSQASTISDQLNTQAYTNGNDVSLAPAGARPDGGNRHLLSHELTHVLQQRGSGGQNSTASEGDEPGDLREEADDDREVRQGRTRDRRRQRNPD